MTVPRVRVRSTAPERTRARPSEHHGHRVPWPFILVLTFLASNSLPCADGAVKNLLTHSPWPELRGRSVATRTPTCTWRTRPGQPAGRRARTSRCIRGPTLADSWTTPRSDRRESRPSSCPADGCTYTLHAVSETKYFSTKYLNTKR